MKIFLGKTSSHHRAQDPISHRIGSDPYLDWKVLVAIALILSCVGIAVGFYSYQDVQARLSAPVPSSIGRQSFFNEDLFSKTIKSFGDRAEEHDALLRGYSGVADPSL